MMTELRTNDTQTDLTCRNTSTTGLSANEMQPAHDDHKALSVDEQNWVKSIKPLNEGKKWCLGSNLTSKSFTLANYSCQACKYKFKCT